MSVVGNEDVAVIAAGEFQHALVGHHDGVDFTDGQTGADIHARTYLLSRVGDVELGLEGVAGGIDGGIDNLDGGGKSRTGIDVALHLHLHALLHLREVSLGNVDDGLQTADLGEGEDGGAGIHLTVLIVLGTDDAGKLGLDEGVLVLEAFCLHKLVVTRLGLVVYLLADTAALLQCAHTVKLGLGGRKVDTGGVELGLVHTHKHGTFLHTAAHLDIDMLNMAGDRGGYVHSLIAFKGGREFE